MILEACVDNLEKAINAEQQGAHRLELCSGLEYDGLTPGLPLLRSVLDNVSIPVRVMLRNESKSFILTDAQVSQLYTYIQECHKLPIDGYVFGSLVNDCTPNFKHVALIKSWIGEKHLVFHKAIDCCFPLSTIILHNLKNAGVNSILTSGGAKTVEEGIDSINDLTIKAHSLNIRIIAAGSITKENISQLSEKLITREYHGKRIC